MLNPEKNPNLEKETIENKKLEAFYNPIFAFFNAQGLNLRIEENPALSTAGFCHETKKIILNPNFYKKFTEKLPEDKESVLDYTIAHELEHFVQLIEDPKGYLKEFELAKKWGKKGEETDKAEIEIWHSLFNVISDTNVIKKIEGHFIPFQERGTKGYLPKKIYQEVLFKEKDFSQQPLTAQFLNSLLREAIVEEKTTIDEKVKEALDTKINFFSKETTLQNLVYEYLAPKEVKTNTRVFAIEKYIKPIFEKLLEEDKQNNRLSETIKILQESDFPSDPSLSKEEVVKDVLKKQRTKEQREKDLKDEAFDKWADKAGFNGKEKQRLKEILETTEKYIETIKQIWYQIIQTKEEEVTEKKVAFNIGVGIDPTKIVTQYPKILETPEKAEIFYRYLTEKKETILPRAIKAILIFDMSGSMDEEKRKKVQEACYPLLKSLIDFENELALNSPEGVSPIKVESMIIGFGDEATFLPKNKSKDPQINLARAIIDCQNVDLGGTKDDKALYLARNQFTPEDLEKIKEQKLLGFILEITDGETFTEETSKKLVREMNKQGIITKGIQIPSIGPSIIEEMFKKPLSKEEEEKLREKLKGTFERVWGNHGKRLNSIEQLKSVITTLLSKALKKNDLI